jgi:sigma-B regulation protein RsbU (phosphoserine phosphatase)
LESSLAVRPLRPRRSLQNIEALVIPPPTPADERDRLADLRALQILDTPPEERFDRIVRLAARIFDVPIAYIALVDAERQWFKARCGLDADSTSRAVSFCGHTIVHDGPLIIPDTTRDERFWDSPLVVNPPHVRMYAGYPLNGPAGHCVGTLCLAAPTPRTLTTAELAMFAELAALAEHELNMVDVIQGQRELLETKDALLKTQQQLATELAEAAAYIYSLLPPKLHSPVRTDWSFVTSSQLGGDLFGYHWLDDSRLAIYLHDVCGHGVGASLLSMAVHNALRRQALPGVRFEEPAEVLAGLNRAFPMEENNNKFFTIWYGVYDTATRTLSYGSAGHPPALVFSGQKNRPLKAGSLMIGVAADVTFQTYREDVWPGSRLYVYSDGVSDIQKAAGGLLNLDGLIDLLVQVAGEQDSRVERLLDQARALQGSPEFRDDFSLVEVEFC